MVLLIHWFVRWKRRFENRQTPDPLSVESATGQDANSSRNSARKVFNNKVYPAGGESRKATEKELEEAELITQKNLRLQKIICVLLCTVFPLLTLSATLLRFWHVGILDFLFVKGLIAVSQINSVSLTQCLDCAEGWSHQHHQCWRPLSIRLNWTEAIHECELLKSNLPTFQASNSLQLSVAHVWLNSSSQDIVTMRRLEKTLEAETRNKNISDDVCPTISKDKKVEKFPCCVKLHVICVKSRDE